MITLFFCLLVSEYQIPSDLQQHKRYQPCLISHAVREKRTNNWPLGRHGTTSVTQGCELVAQLVHLVSAFCFSVCATTIRDARGMSSYQRNLAANFCFNFHQVRDGDSLGVRGRNWYNLPFYSQFGQTQRLISISIQVIKFAKISSARLKRLCDFGIMLLTFKLNLISSAGQLQIAKLWPWTSTNASNHPLLQIQHE